MGSAFAVVRYFHKNGLNFPRRLRNGINKGQLTWGQLIHTRALQILRNPRYAGAYVFGRMKACKRANGHTGAKPLAQEDWHTLIPDAHPGYITWPQYQDNLRTLRACAQARGSDRRKSPPGEGSALLQGLVICGVCGLRMTVRYHHCQGRQIPDYVCQRDGIAHGHAICQSLPGGGIDQTIGELLLEMVQPATLELAFAVRAELQTRLEEVDQLRRQQVERARYEADLASSRYMQVDPRNRLVADALEADWNNRLRALAEAQEHYEKQRQADRIQLDEQGRQNVLALATDLPRLWHDPATSDQDRKRMARLLIEDVTLSRSDQVIVQVRFRGGATRTLRLPLPLTAAQLRKTAPDVISRIDHLLDTCTEAQAADELNREGCRSGTGQAFTLRRVAKLRHAYHLKSRYDRLREAGMLTAEELARRLAVHPQTVIRWRRHGLLAAHPYNDKNECLYEPTEANRMTKQQGVKLSDRCPDSQVMPHATNEVHHEA
jgi:hypothetical protein